MKKLTEKQIKFYTKCFYDVLKLDKKEEFTKQLEILFISYKSTDEENFLENIKKSFPENTVLKIMHNFKIIDKHISNLTINKYYLQNKNL